MALVICPDCGHEISEYANMCPNCGFPLQKFLKENNFTNIVLNVNNNVCVRNVDIVSLLTKIAIEINNE